MKLNLILCLILILTTISSAHGVYIQDLSQKEVEKIEHEFNKYEKNPKVLNYIVGKQKIKATIKNQSANRTFGFRLKGTEITNFSMKYPENPTIEISANKSQINQLLNSNNPIQDVNELLNQDKVKYETYGITNNLRALIFETSLSIISTINNIEF